MAARGGGGSGVHRFPCTAAAVAATRRLLRGRVAPVAVFDIDATLLTPAGAPVRLTVALARDIVRAGGVVELVTARPEDGRAATIAQLAAANVWPLVSDLHMPRRRLHTTKEITRWKAARRADIERKWGRLDVAVGDNLHDVAPVEITDIGSAAVVAQPGDQVGLLVHGHDGSGSGGAAAGSGGGSRRR